MAAKLKRSEKSKQWSAIVEAQARSGKSIPAFCKERKINRYTFSYWRRKFHDAKLSGLRGRFVALGDKQDLALSLARVHLPNGVWIEFGSGVETEVVSRFLRNLCGVGHAKP